jgi:REP element-mobilizing transposase RayT
MRIPRVDYIGAVHHVYGRGNGRQAIVRDDVDRRTFLERLLYYESITGTRVLAYCLMTNHYHLVTQTLRGPLESFMHRLLTSYTRRYHNRWGTDGHLFQGRYGDRVCKTEADARSSIRYVHRNPVEAGIAADPRDWPWSGHRGVLAGHDPILDVPFVLDLFGGVVEYRDFCARSIQKDERPTLETIAEMVAGADTLETLRSPRRTSSLAEQRRQFAVDALAEGYRRSEVARFLGVTGAAITWLLGAELKTEA